MDRVRFSSLILIVFLCAAASSAQTPRTDGWVVLPVSEYTALKHAAAPAEPEPAAPPVEATLSRIDYDLKVDGDLATGEARLTVDVIKNGWVRVAMPDGLMVREAQLDGRPVHLVMNTTDKGPGRADLLLSKTGRSVLTLKIVAPVNDQARRNHQFLIALERTNSETKVEAPVLAFSGAQRETAELLVEGIGAMEMTATESGGLRRMDVREAGAITRSLSHFPLQAAFRYNRRAVDAPKLQLQWTQFLDADVLSAVAERATVTTLTNVEGPGRV